jgi:hypothetical protein
MPIHTERDEYASELTRWSRCRDCFDGADAVKARTTAYLPALDGQEATEYAAYVQRATFYNAFARTVRALSGLMFRRSPAVTAPKAAEPLWLDVTHGGSSLVAFALELAEELCKVGRTGLLVDAPAEGGRPYWCAYRAEDVIAWNDLRMAGVPTLTRVVLREHATEASTDPYVTKRAAQLRELFLDEQGLYTVRRWRKKRAPDGTEHPSEWEVIGPPQRPLRRGQALAFIPFTFVNASNLLADPQRGPMVDLADVNLSHYRTSADLEHGRHYTALPTPYVTGYDGAGGPLVIGASRAWTIGNAAARVGMLEFTGSGLGSLERALQHKEQQMAVLGARLLEAQKAGVEAEGTLRLRHAGDDATLRVLATTLSGAVTRAMRWHAWWSDLATTPMDERYTFALGVDFFTVRMSAQELQALVTTMQAGRMSFETFYFLLQRGDLARPGVTVEEEQHAIDKESEDDAAAGAGDGGDAGDPGDDAGDGAAGDAGDAGDGADNAAEGAGADDAED